MDSKPCASAVCYWPGRSFGVMPMAFSALIAVAIHVALLSLEIPESNRMSRGGAQPIALRLIRSKPSAKPSPRVDMSSRKTVPKKMPVQSTPEQKAVDDEKVKVFEPSTERTKADIQGSPSQVVADTKLRALPKLIKIKPLARIEVQGGQFDDIEGYSVPEGLGEKQGEDRGASGARFLDDDAAHGGRIHKARRGGGRAVEPGDVLTTMAEPAYDENPPPDYPWIARRRGYEGRTRLNVKVLATGVVGRVEIAESSGFDILDEAAVKAVKRWQFVPGTASGKHIAQWVVVPVRFSLE